MQLKKLLSVLAALVSKAAVADAKAVFAHFIVGNVPAFSVADWEGDITQAQQAGIDGFVLNIAALDTSNSASVSKAFEAAQNKNFKLLFSFDYAAWGTWGKGDVISYINQYKVSSAYWQHNGKPLVSTFEGPGNAGDWFDIKSSTGCFFMPEYSSLGPQGAASQGAIDGLFSWDAWPHGASDKSADIDRQYQSALNGKPYMMPVAPWFFTNLPGWGKNWIWRGDDLWYDRWQQVLDVQPEYVEIVTWNDYGESSYIGPLHDSEFGFFSGQGAAPFNYAANMPHDGWRKFLPYVISQYKNGGASVAQEGLTAWFRPNPKTACNSGGTTGNSANNGEQTLNPADVAQDKIFYSALLTSGNGVTVSVSVDGANLGGSWSHTPAGNGAGIYHGSVDFGAHLGAVTVTVSRNGQTISQVSGGSITTNCQAGIENWNAWVGSS